MTPFESIPKFRGRFLLGAVLLLAGSAALQAAQENFGRGRITGTVQDERGNPIAGAQITAQFVGGKGELDGTSDDKGFFAIAGLGTGPWRVAAAKAGYAAASLEIDVKQLRSNTPVNLTMKRITDASALRTDNASSELFDRGNRFFNEAKYDESIQVFEELLAKYPDIHGAHLNIAAASLKKGDMERARSEYQLVLDKTAPDPGAVPKDPATAVRALAGLGEVALKSNDFETAQTYLRRALEVSPADETAAYNVGEIFFSNQKIDEAITFFELAVRIKKDWPRPVFRLGIVYLNKGDFAKSLEYLNRFVQMAPDNPDVPQAKAMIAAVEKMKK